MAKKLKTTVVRKSGSQFEERMFLNPPYTVFGLPHLPESQSIIMNVRGLREMLKGLDDEDSFRIEWFQKKATEYSFISHRKPVV